MHLCSEIPVLKPTQCPQSARCLKLPLLRISLAPAHTSSLSLCSPFCPRSRVPCAVCAGHCGTRDHAPRGWQWLGPVVAALVLQRVVARVWQSFLIQ